MPPRRTIRLKLIAGLSLVVGMMLTLLVGAIFGLHAFHNSNLILMDQLREIGASKRLLETVLILDARGANRPDGRLKLAEKVVEARAALKEYCDELKSNSMRGNRADIGDELNLAFLIDHDLAALLGDLQPGTRVSTMLPGTNPYLKDHPEALPPIDPSGLDSQGRPTPAARLERLNHEAIQLPERLYHDSYNVLIHSRGRFHSSRIIVWTSALAVLAMLCGLARLVHRWVLYPVRLLQRGVRRVARGSFDYQIDLQTGDEMQALAEAFNDMTARLSVTYNDLERQVQERSRQLVRSERLAGVGFLAAGVAHEINNPLASIAFCSEALENRLSSLLASVDSADSAIVADYLRMIQDEAFRCKRITEKLLDFSRCGEIQRRPTDLATLVEEVVEMIRHIGKYREKTIEFHPQEVVIARVDAQEIKQVILNLVVNALDCMDSGGRLDIQVRRCGASAELIFADDGKGMSPEVLENIFEPFFTTKGVGKGTGLGLSISHRIISRHEGEIVAESPGEGFGSTFTIRLPAEPRDAEGEGDGEPKSWRIRNESRLDPKADGRFVAA